MTVQQPNSIGLAIQSVDIRMDIGMNTHTHTHFSPTCYYQLRQIGADRSRMGAAWSRPARVTYSNFSHISRMLTTSQCSPVHGMASPAILCASILASSGWLGHFGAGHPGTIWLHLAPFTVGQSNSRQIAANQSPGQLVPYTSV